MDGKNRNKKGSSSTHQRRITCPTSIASAQQNLKTCYNVEWCFLRYYSTQFMLLYCTSALEKNGEKKREYSIALSKSATSDKNEVWEISRIKMKSK